MKVARIRVRDTGAETYGLVRGDRIAAIGEIRTRLGVPVPPRVADFVSGGWAGEVGARASELEYGLGLDECDLLAPVPDPGKILCVAFNYEGHAAGHGGGGREAPVVVMKPATALCGAGGRIVCPSFVQRLDYETELALVIGRRTKCADTAEAAGSIFGYTILNDISAREIQFGDGQFTRAKGFDTFAPCGPWITTADEAGDPASMRIRTSVNGELRQDALAGSMRKGPETIVSELSRSMTLEPGDIISTGTPGGTALDRDGDGYLADGDLLRSEISGLGALENRVEVV